jgi:hypothetical protein
VFPRYTIALPLCVGCCFARSAMHYAQTTSCELSLWFGMSGLRFVAPPQLSLIQSWSMHSEPDYNLEPRTQRTRPATPGRLPSRPEPVRPERPSCSPPGSSPTPHISILALSANHRDPSDICPYLHGADRRLIDSQPVCFRQPTF